MISETINSCVTRCPAGSWEDINGSCRTGTAYLSINECRARFGEPDWREDIIGEYPDYAPYLQSDGKVTCIWFFKTPRGMVEVRDYWWNGPEEMSIAANNHKATLWIKAWLRRNGIRTWQAR